MTDKCAQGFDRDAAAKRSAARNKKRIEAEQDKATADAIQKPAKKPTVAKSSIARLAQPKRNRSSSTSKEDPDLASNEPPPRRGSDVASTPADCSSIDNASKGSFHVSRNPNNVGWGSVEDLPTVRRKSKSEKNATLHVRHSGTALSDCQSNV